MKNFLYHKYKVEAWDTLQHLFKVKKINDHTMHFTATLKGKLDLERLKRAVSLSADAFPLLRSSFNEAGGRAYWEDKGYKADDMIMVLEPGKSEDSITQLILKEIDTKNSPQIRILIIRNQEFDKLFISMNHMLCDAAGFKEYLYLLCSIYNNNSDDNLYMKAMGDRRIRQIFHTFSIRNRFKIMFSRNDMFSHDQADFGLEGDLSNPFIEVRKISRERFCLLKNFAKKYNATVNDVILSAYMRVLFQMFGRTVTIPSTVDLRKYLPDHAAGGICNLCTNLTCNIGQEIGKKFEDTLSRVKQAMDKEKSGISCVKSVVLMETAFDILPYKTARNIIQRTFTNSPIAFTNIGIIDKNRLNFGKTEVLEAYMTGSIKYSPYFQLAISTFDDLAVLSVNSYGTQADKNRISLFLEQLLDELQSAIWPDDIG